jgi:hypothetical protein
MEVFITEQLRRGNCAGVRFAVVSAGGIFALAALGRGRELLCAATSVELGSSFEKDATFSARRESARFFCDRMSKEFGASGRALARELHIF